MEPIISGVGVLDKAVTVLDALAPGPRTLAELVEATGLPRATCHRLATALEVHGLVRRDGDGRFALGLRLAALGRAATGSFHLEAVALPALHWLRAQTDESVQLYVREGDRRVCIASLESPHGLRTIVPVGARLTLEAGSAAKVFTGALDGRDGRPRAGTLGWVDSVGEREAGVASVSAPVRDATGQIAAAVSVSGPIERTSREPGFRYGTAVVEAAAMVEVAAGFRSV